MTGRKDANWWGREHNFDVKGQDLIGVLVLVFVLGLMLGRPSLLPLYDGDLFWDTEDDLATCQSAVQDLTLGVLGSYTKVATLSDMEHNTARGIRQGDQCGAFPEEYRTRAWRLIQTLDTPSTFVPGYEVFSP